MCIETEYTGYFQIDLQNFKLNFRVIYVFVMLDFSKTAYLNGLKDM